jgi:hypothetical protein
MVGEVARENGSNQVQRPGWRFRENPVLAVAVIIMSSAILLTLINIWLWGLVESYINLENAAGRDVMQVFTLVAASISAVVGLGGLFFPRRTLRHHQEALLRTLELETRRARDTALQTYWQEVGDLL